MSIQREGRVPAARTDGLAITESNDEVLVYDTAKHHIHHLNQATAVIWRLCDGNRSVRDLAREAQLTMGADVSDEAVRLALTKLEDANLLDGALGADIRVSTESRRTLFSRALGAGAGAVIVSIAAPAAAAAQSSGDDDDDDDGGDDDDDDDDDGGGDDDDDDGGGDDDD